MKSLRDLGVEYKFDGGTIWVNPAKYCSMTDIVITALNRIQPYDVQAESDGNHRINNYRHAFTVVEGYVLDMELKDDIPLAEYWSRRPGLSYAEKWVVFNALLDTDDHDVIFDALDATRPPVAELAEKDEKKSGNSSSPEQTTTPKESQAQKQTTAS